MRSPCRAPGSISRSSTFRSSTTHRPEQAPHISLGSSTAPWPWHAGHCTRISCTMLPRAVRAKIDPWPAHLVHVVTLSTPRPSQRRQVLARVMARRVVLPQKTSSNVMLYRCSTSGSRRGSRGRVRPPIGRPYALPSKGDAPPAPAAKVCPNIASKISSALMPPVPPDALPVNPLLSYSRLLCSSDSTEYACEMRLKTRWLSATDSGEAEPCLSGWCCNANFRKAFLIVVKLAERSTPKIA
mmetsp:Transcript_4683/g.15159  ORF Transcript_4683/g.15159 Transcript_4683/m.15159 type:complete len:241 (-) Transcript_4683:111-833(-)